VLVPVGWPTFFRIHWLALLFQAGVRPADPPPDELVLVPLPRHRA
jgi:hypothetical protein